MSASAAMLYPAQPVAPARDRPRETPAVTLRAATAADASAIEALVARHALDARLLPRHAAEIAANAARFVVAVQGEALVACADLVPLSSGGGIAEVRSLVVALAARGVGVGTLVLEAVVARAREAGCSRLCAFTHAPAWFVARGFSTVPHAWVPEKLSADCHACTALGRCGQVAVMRLLDRPAPRAGGPGR